jgi:UDP-2-acetamido-3-amino-2,3-dideoxy-glucuronate N-acetyltransferase
MNKDFFSHKSAIISEDTQIGKNTKIWHYSHIFGSSTVGENCVIGQNVMIGPNVILGNGCKIQNNVSLYKGIILEDDVFCGPSCVFTNVKTPRAFIDRSNEFSNTHTIVRKGVSIGANATIICGVELGKFCMIGAGALVTKNVKPYSLVIGSPAKHIGWISEAGERLDNNLICNRTGKLYEEDNGILYEKKL